MQRLKRATTRKPMSWRRMQVWPCLRAHRGYPKNKKLRKLLGEQGVEQLKQRTEFYYLQDNAKNMPFRR